MIESRPAKNAAGNSAIEAGELTIELPLELRVQARPPVRGRGYGGGRSRAAPAPDQRRNHGGADKEPRERQEPREPVEPLPRRRREDGRPELVDELCLDLLLRRAGLDTPLDVRLDLPGDRGVGLVESGFARRTDQLALEVGERRARGRGRSREGQREHGDGEGSHAVRISCTHASNRSRFRSRWTPP